MIKKRTLTLAALLFAAWALPALAANTYSVDKAHSDVGFQVRHLVSQVRGRFTDSSGTIVKDDANPAGSSVTFTVQAASIDTGVADRDNHLRSEDFFAVDKFPQITFKSTSVEKVSDTEYKVTGDFTLHGVTKVLTLPVSYQGEMKDPGGKVRAGFSTSTTINRKDFGINWNKALDSGGFLLSDEVKIDISLEVKQAS